MQDYIEPDRALFVIRIDSRKVLEGKALTCINVLPSYATVYSFVLDSLIFT